MLLSPASRASGGAQDAVEDGETGGPGEEAENGGRTLRTPCLRACPPSTPGPRPAPRVIPLAKPRAVQQQNKGEMMRMQCGRPAPRGECEGGDERGVRFDHPGVTSRRRRTTARARSRRTALGAVSSCRPTTTAPLGSTRSPPPSRPPPCRTRRLVRVSRSSPPRRRSPSCSAPAASRFAITAG